VRAIEVTTNHCAYDICPSVAPGYQELVGARSGGGWRKAVTEAVGRTKGMHAHHRVVDDGATVAFQTMASWKPQEGAAAERQSRTSSTAARPGRPTGRSCRSSSHALPGARLR
jgi:hypothetical protein